MELIVVCPDQLDWNEGSPLYGKSDVAFNSKGKENAEAIREKLRTTPIDQIIVPDLKRIVFATEIIKGSRGVPITKIEGLMERNYGTLEGHHVGTIDPLWDYHEETKIEGGESTTEFFQRVYQTLDAIEEKCVTDNVLLVAPRGVTIPVECYYQGVIPEGPLTELACPPGEVRSYVRYEGKRK